ncbi:hypothetical protein [Actinoplanes couchii]|uniref:Uncharacterized protein n=1 Tax=Actinoplanes couchii TaxID=403638 RepID=A0ABQ3XBB3_9ACTN|nr:hypothetical protein [Actinoplanes couchii]MDR6323298.1 hypothetical protein [Actinoplanes couchii]GID55811.1 hypothetical protein Aco03nite_042150 [Actinoplanes couchii]
MSTQEHIYFQSRQAPSAFAAEFAPAAGMTVIRGPAGETYLSRPLTSGGQIGGELHRNDLFIDRSLDGAPDPVVGPASDPADFTADFSGDFSADISDVFSDDEPSFLDVFPLVLAVGITVPDRDRQLAEARALFTELAAISPVPVALVRGYDFLIGTASSSTGLLWFPDNTIPYLEHRETWLPFQPPPPPDPSPPA